MPMVYSFKKYSVITDEQTVAPRKATTDFIQGAGGEIIEGSGIEVDESELNSEGQHVPPGA